MKKINSLLICLLASLLLAACGPSQATQKATATQTAAAPPSTATATPTLTVTPTLTDTPTPTPVPTATPAPGIEVPTTGGRWQVTVEGAREEDELTVGFYPNRTTYTPKEAGYAFLVVDFKFRSLDPAPRVGVPSQAISVIGVDGQILTPIGIGGFLSDDYVCVEECSYILKPSVHHLAFLVKEDVIDQPWELHFPDVPPIPFSVSGEAEHAFITEVGSEQDALPSNCQINGSTALSDAGPLSYTYWAEGSLTLASMAADGSQATEICTGIAFANLKRAADGGAALLVGPRQGWPNLYAVEPDGRVFVLVKNSQNIMAEFDPTGRYLFFTATKLGEDKEELYVFDRETASVTLVQAGDWVNFRFLANGRLLVTVQPSGNGDEQSFLSRTDVTDLVPLDLPDGVDTYEIADDGEHLVYSDLDDSANDQLFIAKLDGSDVQKLVTTEEYVSGELSPNGQFILINFMSFLEETGEFRHKIELYNLATNDRWTIIQDSPDLETDFSADSRWALVYSTIEGEGAEEDQKTLYLISTADGRIAHEIENVINAVFSPDNSQLAYTVRETDGNPAIYVLSLESGATQSLGSGVVSDWLLASGMASDTLTPTPTVEETEDAGSASQTVHTTTLPQTPTPIPTSTPIAMSVPFARVVADVANLRSGPGTSYPVVEESRQGDRLQIIGRDASAGWWQVITADGRKAWVNAGLVEVTQAEGVSVVTAPPPPATPTPSQNWVLVADSAADFPGSILDRKWWYLWSEGRHNFIWQDMVLVDNQCYHSPNDWTLEICRDALSLDGRGDAALLWKATKGGTYRFEWDSSAVRGETTLRFHKRLDFVGSQGPGMELPYSAVVEGVMEWELFFWVPQYDTPYRVKVYKLQE